MKRGDLVVASAPGDYGKPRPALIVQTDLLNDTHSSVLVCLITSDIVDAPLFRILLEPTPENGLERRSQVMIDKVVALRRERFGKAIGVLDADTMLQVNRSLALVMGLGD